jgi:hypothetical protein
MADVVENKKEFILAHPLLKNSERIDSEELSAHWEDIVGVLKTLLDSDLSNLEHLKTADVGDYLATTGREAMGGLAEFTANRFEGARAETVSQDADKAVVRITFPSPEDAAMADSLLRRLTQIDSDSAKRSAEDASREISLVLVEGKWIPQQLAEGWSGRMSAANERLKAMTPDYVDFFKHQWLPMLDSVDRVMASVQKAQTQEKFEAVVDKQVLPPLFSVLALVFPGSVAPPVFPAAASEPKQKSSEGDVVTIVFATGLDQDSEAKVSVELMSVVDNPELGIAVPGVDNDGNTRIEVSPVGDVDAFAGKIEFAEVVKVDAKKRTITVKPLENSRRPQ